MSYDIHQYLNDIEETEGPDFSCDRCGESLGDEARAEIGMTPSHPDYSEPIDVNDHQIVHAEPCAMEAIATGRWELA